MKIEQPVRFGLGKNTLDQKNTPLHQTTFSSIVQQQGNKLHHNQLNELLIQIEQAGERLSRQRTFRELIKYKQLVKRMVKEAIDFGLEVKQSQTWNIYGENQSMDIVQLIDKQLLELTELTLSENRSLLDVLNKVGEIKGLLINLYM